jgi:hypothetical protein
MFQGFKFVKKFYVGLGAGYLNSLEVTEDSFTASFCISPESS